MRTTVTTDEERQEIIKKFRRHETDSGSPHVQVALLTTRINEINEHLKKNKKDHHSRRGLLKLVGRRNRLLKYLSRIKRSEYKELIGVLGLRK